MLYIICHSLWLNRHFFYFRRQFGPKSTVLLDLVALFLSFSFALSLSHTNSLFSLYLTYYFFLTRLFSRSFSRFFSLSADSSNLCRLFSFLRRLSMILSHSLSNFIEYRLYIYMIIAKRTWRDRVCRTSFSH